MPTILDATVVNQAYDTSGNGGRKLVRLSNGWLVAAEIATNGSYKNIYLQISKDNGATWQPLVNTTDNYFSYAALASYGTKVYVLGGYTYSSYQGCYLWVIDTLNPPSVLNGYNGTSIDTQNNALNGVSLAINEAGTELHAAWASKNSAYSNSFNIRYAKGTINADGSVTWGAVEQVTKRNDSSDNFNNPSVVISNGIPLIFFCIADNFLYSTNSLGTGSAIQVLKRDSSLLTHTLIDSKWTYQNVYYIDSANYTQSSPSACVDKNGRIWVAWHGRDATDTNYDNIRVSYSDDGGTTWSTAQKLTSGNTYSQTNPSITVNRNNEIFIVWTGSDYTDSYRDIRMIKYNGSWSSISNISIGTTNHKWNPSALYDTMLDFSTPLFIYQDLQANKVGFYGTWVVNTISVTPGYIGQKTSADKSNILTYSITTDGTMSTITEKINGVTIATRTNPTSGQEFTVSLNQAQWDAIKFGNGHTLTIEMNGEIWTYTFDKRLNANDDILSAVKGVHDLQTHLNGIKAQLGAAIRAKGGTVNDTDAWSAFVSAVGGLGFVGSKKFASGTVTSSSTSSPIEIPESKYSTENYYTITVSGLTFKPKIVLVYTSVNQLTIYNESQTGYEISCLSSRTYDDGFRLEASTSSTLTVGGAGVAYVNDTGFKLPVNASNTSFNWIAFE